ncbi:3-keto-5-aminohexanoate cleavage protein [Streptomyces sp. TG1A-8]|uniref:3-keto-5-aminohexanoate cleavage protein n=1 Tax=Streptomyces sp. TG1A-8 TaxID=3051385 RepID=UPI00265C4794|nr:3-keto-5-aminohexanoate cleavage protein [Streptomyces sp. TG1A-8]MDO0929038.1 3-keto-5-aminohexanoate cleavage protein [Streptomyces sp. TG1A-8]
MLQVCLNGSRTTADCPWVPVGAEELAAEARRAVDAGAEDIHLHPKDADGRDTLDPGVVGEAVRAVRRSVGPRIRVGVTTGAWTEPDPRRRAALVRSWTTLPDHASVNWHEEGADLVAEALADRGIGIEAGLHSGTDALRRFTSSPFVDGVLRVLVEITDTPADRAAVAGRRLVEDVSVLSPAPVLLHGVDDTAWPVLDTAAALGVDTRTGLEDTLLLPGGTPAQGNEPLVRTARRVLNRYGNSGPARLV